MNISRTVASCNLVTDLLQQLLEKGTETNLVVCGTKSEFLIQLSAAIRAQRADPEATSRHDLLTKTIGLLANSSRIRLTFCPSLESLRAYLAILPRRMNEKDSEDIPLLAILDMVALHVPTSEFAAQGLSRTFASAVEAAARANMSLMLCECTNAVNPASSDWGPRLWSTHIPLLNGSVRIRGEEGNWGGRGVGVDKVARRWFTFEEELQS